MSRIGKQVANNSPLATPHELRATVSRGWRMTRNLGWMVAEQALAVGLPRLLLFPLCERYMGAADFGQFIFALGVVNMAGLSIVKGLTNSVYREYGSLTVGKREVAIRTAFHMGAGVFATLLVFAIAVCVGVQFATGNDIWKWIALLIPSVVAQSIMQLGVVDLSIMRRFDLRAAWMGLGGLGVLLALPAIFIFGSQHAPIGYSVGILISMCILIAARRKLLFKRPRYASPLALVIARSWFVLWLQAILALGSRYTHRTLLGICSPFDDVARFFSAMSIIDVFVMPVAMIATLLMALLARHASIDTIPRRILIAYAGFSVAGAAMFTGFLKIWGPDILKFLYPRLASEASSALAIMAPGAGLLALTSVARPFVLKFFPLNAVPLLSVLALLSHLIPGLLLIPKSGLRGAAQSFCIGACITGIAWFGVLLVMIRQSGRAADVSSTSD